MTGRLHRQPAEVAGRPAGGDEVAGQFDEGDDLGRDSRKRADRRLDAGFGLLLVEELLAQQHHRVVGVVHATPMRPTTQSASGGSTKSMSAATTSCSGGLGRSDSNDARCSARAPTCCFSHFNVTSSPLARAWMKKIRAPGSPMVPAVNRWGRGISKLGTQLGARAVVAPGGVDAEHDRPAGPVGDGGDRARRHHDPLEQVEVAAHRLGDGGLDRVGVAHGDDDLPGMGGDDALDGRADAQLHLGERLALGEAERRRPVLHRLPLRQLHEVLELGAGPRAEVGLEEPFSTVTRCPSALAIGAAVCRVRSSGEA